MEIEERINTLIKVEERMSVQKNLLLSEVKDDVNVWSGFDYLP
jgi:hypothetical protein